MINFTLKTVAVDPNEPDAGLVLDRLVTPQQHHNIIFRRVVAYRVDFVFVAGLMPIAFVAINISGLITLRPDFMFIGSVIFITPLAYHIFIFSGPHSATWGMRLTSIEVQRWQGGRPDLPQAAVLMILVYGSATMIAWFILAVASLSNSRRCLHDYISGTVVVNKHIENGATIGRLAKLLPY